MNYRRRNPLTGEWVIVAANRVTRPWQGARESKRDDVRGGGFAKSDVPNPLAPGGARTNGVLTPHYEHTFVFQNDFPSFTDDGLRPEGDSEARPDDLYVSRPIRGTCRVICYSPDSELSLVRMAHSEIEKVIDVWIQQFNDLEAKYDWIQIFENKGAMVGCSNAHPHGQLWASDYLPNIPAKKYSNQKAYKKRTGRAMLMDVVDRELCERQRLVVENEGWLVVVPFWAVWPFETLLLPKVHVSSLNRITCEQKAQLARIVKLLLTKYDNLFQCSFPFSMGWLGAPTGRYLAEDTSCWTLHAEYLPPLLRSATVKKFMAGYELVCEPQRDITPEKAAELLRSQSDEHYADCAADGRGS